MAGRCEVNETNARCLWTTTGNSNINLEILCGPPPLKMNALSRPLKKRQTSRKNVINSNQNHHTSEAQQAAVQQPKGVVSASFPAPRIGLVVDHAPQQLRRAYRLHLGNALRAAFVCTTSLPAFP
jgi:hypothetical protein